MKTLFIKKASLIVLCLTFSPLARGAAVVKQLKGNAFMIFDTKTQSLHTGDHIPLGAEVLTEEGTELTLANYFNHQFHTTGSCHLKVGKKSTVLLEGYLWFRALNQGRGGPLSFDVKTANGIVQYNDTEGIISFDPGNGKTQYLNLRGNNVFFNKVRPGPQYEVSTGMFSFIHNKHNRGIPKRPAPIGIKPYKKLMALFENIRPLPPIPGMWDQEPGRGIASIGGGNDLKEILKKYSLKRNNRRSNPSPIKVNIYAPSSGNWNTDEKKEADEPLEPVIKIGKKKPRNPGRSPASLNAPSANPFEEALQSRYKDNKRQKKELNSLIDALKSVNQDYQ